jgi:hypothetical protein
MGSNLTLDHVSIKGGHSGVSTGAGIFVNQGTVSLTSSTLVGNTSSVAGAAMFGNAGAIRITDSTISGNVVEAGGGSGGGIVVNGGMLTVTNSTFSGNAAPTAGGIWTGTGGTTTLIHSTFSNNSGSFSNILNSVGTTEIRATVLERGPTGINCSGAITSLGSNVSDDASCGLGASGDQEVGEGEIRLGPLADNGGPTSTHALQSSSPAIDAVLGACNVSDDQRGFSRPVDGDSNGSTICDSGSFELRLPAGESAAAARAAVEAAQHDPNNDDEDEDVKDRRETEEARQQRERTNHSNKDDYVLEGNVVGLCESGSDPPCVIVANRDGNVKVILLGDASKAAGSVKVGDYLEADGEKIHEGLFEAESVSVR